MGEPAGFLNVLHGGRRIQLLGATSFDGHEFDYQNGVWTDVGDPFDQPPGIPGGTWSSFEQLSHDGDSVVTVRNGGGPALAQITVLLRDTSASSQPRALATLSNPLEVAQSTCAQKDANFDRSDSVTVFLGYECTQTEFQSLGSSTSAFATPAFSPLGDRVIVTVDVRRHTKTGITGWEPCPWSGTEPDTGVESSLCRTATYASSDLDALVYSIRTSDGQIETLPSIPASHVYWRGVNESGEELVIGAGQRTETSTYEPFSTVSDSGVARHGWRLTPLTSTLTSCRVEYRELASGTVLRSVPTNDPCTTQGLPGSGTLSPLRVANGVMSGAPSRR